MGDIGGLCGLRRLGLVRRCGSYGEHGGYGAYGTCGSPGPCVAARHIGYLRPTELLPTHRLPRPTDHSGRTDYSRPTNVINVASGGQAKRNGV